MAFRLYFCLLSVWSTISCTDIPDGLVHMECHDRYFIMTIDLPFAGNKPHLQAVDRIGVYNITEQYQALCGYSIIILPRMGQAEFRASYFSCHAENTADETFVFKFNLIATHEGREVTYNLNKTCSPSLRWSAREVSCEVNYMEISVRSDMTCPSGTKKDDWNDALTTAYVSATSDWQVMFQMQGQRLTPMTLTEARKQGYMFDVTDGRLVFRTSYGQPHSFKTLVDGVPVEVIYTTLFSRRSWAVLMVDLVASCSMYEGSYNDSSMMWKTPLLLPFLSSPLGSVTSGLNGQLRMGVNGDLLEPHIVNERGYVIEETETTVQISIPHDDEAGYRKSLVLDNKYHECFVFYLYVEHLFVDEDKVQTRLRQLRRLTTPPRSQPAFSDDKTVPEEHVFTVYMGAFPDDVELAAVKLNGLSFTMPLMEKHRSVDKVDYYNTTHGYTVRVPFEDPAVQRQLSKNGVLQYRLEINCSLIILPEKEPYYHLASVEALFTDVFPPTFDGFCTDKAISFKLQHRPFDYLWQAYIGSEPLTPELAVQKGYSMLNDSQSLRLDVPLFSAGYTYENICLKKFSASFEIIIKDAKTLEVHGRSVKACPFPTTELVVCSTRAQMTVVADLSMAIPAGGKPSRVTLLDKRCVPIETIGNRVLFSFPMRSCGSRVKLDEEHGNVIYENEIVFNQKLFAVPPVTARNTDKVTVQCVYPLAGLHRLFLLHRFESDFPGMGRVVHTTFNSMGSVAHTTNTMNNIVEQLHPTTPVQFAHYVGPLMPVATTIGRTTANRLATTTRPTTTTTTTRPTKKRPVIRPKIVKVKFPSSGKIPSVGGLIASGQKRVKQTIQSILA